MKRTVITLAVALGFQLLGGCTAQAPPQPTPAPSQSAPMPVQDPLADEQSVINLENTLVDYYTAGRGQQHYNDRVGQDLLLTRYYIYDRETGNMGVIARIEGTIDGFHSDENGLFFLVTGIRNETDGLRYIDFVENVLSRPDIEYRQAPPVQGVSINWDIAARGRARIPVDLIGELPRVRPIQHTDPFGLAQTLSPLHQAPYITDPATGSNAYIKNGFSLGGGDARTLPFLIEGKEMHLPIKGSAVMEQLIVDTQDPANAALLAPARDYSGFVKGLVGTNLQYGGKTYPGTYFTFNEANGTRGYFVVDPDGTLNPVELEQAARELSNSGEKVKFRARELNPAILDLESSLEKVQSTANMTAPTNAVPKPTQTY